MFTVGAGKGNCVRIPQRRLVYMMYMWLGQQVRDIIIIIIIVPTQELLHFKNKSGYNFFAFESAIFVHNISTFKSANLGFKRLNFVTIHSCLSSPSCRINVELSPHYQDVVTTIRIYNIFFRTY